MGKPITPRDPRRRAADRRAGLRLDARASASSSCRSSSSRGVAQVPLHAARAGGRVRDARQLLPVAHARADDGALPAAGRGRTSTSPAAGRRRAAGSGPVHRASTAASSGSAAAYAARSRWALDHRWRRRRSPSSAFVASRSLSSRCSATTSSPRVDAGRSASTSARPPARASRRRSARSPRSRR